MMMEKAKTQVAQEKRVFFFFFGFFVSSPLLRRTVLRAIAIENSDVSE